MVLPDAPCQSREIQVSVSISAHAFDVNPEVVVVDDRNCSSSNAVASEPK